MAFRGAKRAPSRYRMALAAVIGKRSAKGLANALTSSDYSPTRRLASLGAKPTEPLVLGREH
ncbi:MAG: hypothetical protein FWD29_07450 [Micrococcales bacterium]|nr:hypothetical protein [Micrococcales bacterium]